MPPPRRLPPWNALPYLERVEPDETCYLRVKVVQPAYDLVITDAGLVERPVVWVQTIDSKGQLTEPDRVIGVQESDLVKQAEATAAIRRAIYLGEL